VKYDAYQRASQDCVKILGDLENLLGSVRLP